MRRALLPTFIAFATIGACGGTVASAPADCPTSPITPRSGCSKPGLECPYTVVSVDCNGKRTEMQSSCLCESMDGWSCPHAMPPPFCADAGVLDSGTTPKSVTCNGMPCAVPDNYCCDQGMLPKPGVEKCVPNSVSSCGGMRRSCDETADCGVGEACCTAVSAAFAFTYSTQCAPAANCTGMDPYMYRHCKSSSECPMGVTCVAQLCQGHMVQTCGGIPAQRCQ
jgi:hypothetical protein